MAGWKWAADPLSSKLMLVALPWATWIAWSDWRYRRVPNKALWPVLMLVAVSLLVLGVTPAGATALQAALGLLLGLALTLPGHALGQLGAGDVKLVAAIGALQGWQALCYSLLVAALLLGAASLALGLHLGWAMARKQRLPAAVAICAGFMLSLVMPEWMR